MWRILLFVLTHIIPLIATGPSSVCRGDENLRGKEGVILSHPSAGHSRYAANQDCKWIVTGRRGKVVHLQFDFFSLEQSSGCMYDNLTVFDGPDDTSTQIAKLCGTDRPADIYSSGQSLTLKFKSDDSTAGKGFRIRYKLVNTQKRIPVTFSVSQVDQEINSVVTLRCGPRSSLVDLSGVNLTFAGGQQVIWKEGKFSNAGIRHLRHDFDEDGKSLTVAVSAAAFMNGTVQCRLESADLSSVGVEERRIALRWGAEPRRLVTRIVNKIGSWMKEGDTLNVSCEVEVGSPPTKDRVTFSVAGMEKVGQITFGSVLLKRSSGWTLRNVSTEVRLSWRHDGKTIGCSLGGKTLTKRLTVHHAPTSLVIGPPRVSPGQAVRCTAEGRPTPSVRMRMSEEKAGNTTAELVVGKDAESGSYRVTVVCEAENIHGKRNRSAVVVVVVSKKTVLFVLLVVSAAFIGVLLIVNILLILQVLRMRRASATSINEPARFPMSSNIYNTDVGEEYVAMSSNVPDQLAQTTSLNAGSILASNVYEEMLDSRSLEN